MSTDKRRVMANAHQLCPINLGYMDRMEWMANYFIKNYNPDRYAIIKIDSEGKVTGQMRIHEQ